MRRAVIITGGGTGIRMESALPKQFLEINGKPLIVHTIDLFLQFDKDITIVVVLPELYFQLWEDIKKEYFPEETMLLAAGGKTRFDSVKSGLTLLQSNMIIGVHDAVRPLVSVGVIRECYKLAESKGSAIPVISLSESVRRVEGERNYFVPREGLKIVQTPQVFRGELLMNAFKRDFEDDFTDEAIVVERSEVDIYLTVGNPENIKITTPYDLKLAECLLGKR